MTSFIDYLFYICCNYYKRFKDGKNPDYTRGSNIILIAALPSIIIGLFIYMQILAVGGHIPRRIVDSMVLALLIFGLIPFIYGIQNRKRIKHKDLHSKFEKMDKSKTETLNVFAAIYLFVVFSNIFTLATLAFHAFMSIRP